jgi:signal transduction histidine kinase/integral membrane sensor domain MASE1
VAVAVAYYVGVQIGLALTFRPATTSVLWPPNSLLTAALLLVPVRHWWVCLGAALPVHFLVEIGAGMAPELVALLFLTNCVEAVIAAGGVRLLSDSPTQFDTFRRVAAFLGAAVLVAPVWSSFADAAVVHFLRGESYWDVWRTRTLANALTELSVVPLVVRGVISLMNGVEWPSARRLGEIGLFAVSLGCIAIWVFSGPEMRGMPPTPSVLLLPLYFWAAVRFGVVAVSAAIFATAFIASYEAGLGHRAFAVLPPTESLIAVQFYLTVMGLPLMCIAGLLEERRRAAFDLGARLRFEALLSTISGAFVHQPLPSAFSDGLRRVGEFLNADYVGLLLVGDSGHDLQIEWRWHQPSAASLASRNCVDDFPWAFGRVLEGKTLVCDSLEALPEEAMTDRLAFQSLELQSAVVLPLAAGSLMQGALSLVTVGIRPRPAWELPQLHVIAEVLANACARRRAELEVQRSRQKLAHMARLSSMGELTASLAHQLNQPLTGILNNANAARRLIDGGQATIAQLRDIVVDIIDDDRRAGKVIKRVREMLTRTDWSPVPVDANALVQDVAMLIASDAILRNVSVSFAFAPGPLMVTGNRTDLEQVLLNVVTNAMDAVADRPVPQRLVTMETACDNGSGDVLFVVRDRGAGLPAGSEHEIFEPFVTTKPGGMGMGLAVARSLVEDHGGSIRAANDPAGGAVVTISIPAVPEPVA